MGHILLLRETFGRFRFEEAWSVPLRETLVASVMWDLCLSWVAYLRTFVVAAERLRNVGP